MPVVYLDSVFLLNAAMDYLLLRGTELLSGVPAGRRRCVLAALFGGGYAAAVFLPVPWTAARCARRNCYPASRRDAEAPGGAIDGGHRFRRAAAFPAADAAALRPLLRHGGLRAGAGDALRRHAGGAGRLLYPGGPAGAARRRHLGLSFAECCLPGGGWAGDGGQASAPAHPPGWPGDRPRRPLRQRQRPPGCWRTACGRPDGGGGTGALSPGAAAVSHGGGPPGPGGTAGGPPAAGGAACAAALPDGGGRRTAAGPPL